MAVTIVSEQMYMDGVAQTTPNVVGKYLTLYAGRDRSDNTYHRWVTVLTCNTTAPLSSLTLELMAYTNEAENTDSTKYLGMFVTTTKNDAYVTTEYGGETKLRFSCNCTDNGSFVANNTLWARGTVTKNIPTGTFYIYIVPYQDKHNYSRFYSKDWEANPASVEGTEITTIYKATLNNQSATTAGTAALWYIYNTYISPYYYYTDSNCATGLASSKITIPAKTGYTFGGYYTSTGGAGTQYITSGGVMTNDLYKQSGNKTLYAKWTAKTFTVTFDPNGGSTSTASKTVTYNSTYGTLPTPTKTGYTFSGWYTAKSGGTKITSSTTVSITAAQTLYARWTAKTFTVTFDANGGTTSTESKTVTYASTYGTLPTPTRTGHTFSGWYTATSGGTKITADTTVSITAAQTLYAQWTANEYSVTINPNGGSYEGSTSATTLATGLKYGTNRNATLAVPEKNGYKFLGYFTAAEAGSMVYDETGACVKNSTYWNSSGAYKSTSDLTVYAQWKANGLIHIGTGSSVMSLQIYVGTGDGVKMLMPLVGDGTNWNILS